MAEGAEASEPGLWQVPDARAVRDALTTGITAVTAAGDRIPEGAPTPCVGWSAGDLVRHLEAIAGAYVLWVAAAVGGRIGLLRVGAELAAWNQMLIDRLPPRPVASHLHRFDELAHDHLRLVDVAGDTPMLRTPHGVTWTVGEHAAVAAVEWHVHAWDLARAAEADHRPSAATTRLLAATWTTVLGPAIDTSLPTTDDPWGALLLATGRRP